MMKDADLSVYDKISRIVLFGNDPSPVAYSVKSITLADKGFLRRKAYPLSARPHGKFYVLFELGNELNVDGVLSEDGAEVCVYTSRWVGVIDKTFFGKKKYPSENRTVVRTFNQLKPYYQRWSAAVAFTPTQLDFMRSLGVDTSKDVPFPGPEEKDAKFTFIDLFAGIGGFRLAMQRNGGRCVFSSEWNESAQKTYVANYGDKPYGDITKRATKDAIPEDFDILCAGFPCQPFSIAGVSKKKSLGRATGFQDKTQGTLFFDVCKILEQRRPKAFLLENVKNLCSHDKGNTFRVICEALDELNYSIAYQVIDGQNFVPQHRERILIVGFDRERYGEHVDFDFKIRPVTPKPVVRDILEDAPDPKYTLSDKLWIYLQNYAAKHKAAGNGFGYGIAPLDGVSRTLSARYYKDGSEILIAQKGKNPRRLTPHECARLMGYPPDFKIVVSDCQAYKQFGNSVVMPLMADVGRLIVAKLSKLDR